MAIEESKKDLILTGVREVDEKLGGGIPLGSLGLIEGQSDAGKSVLSQQLTYGSVKNGSFSVAYYTTENTVKSLINQMDSLSLYTLDHFLCDHLRIYPLTISDKRNLEGPLFAMARHFSSLPAHFRLIIVDSITLLVSHSGETSVIDFFSACKNICDQGRSIFLVAHSYAFDDEKLNRTRSLCDAHLKLRLEEVGDRMVKILEVLKVRGAERATGDVVSFAIEPKIGMRIIPLSKARV